MEKDINLHRLLSAGHLVLTTDSNAQGIQHKTQETMIDISTKIYLRWPLNKLITTEPHKLQLQKNTDNHDMIEQDKTEV